MNTRTPFYVLSGERADLNEILNAGRSAFLGARLRDDGICAHPVRGVYKGRRERSFLIPAIQEGKDPMCIHDTVKRVAKLYEQETYLYVDANGFSTLHDPDGQLVATLGRWRQIDANEAQSADAYTETPDGRYWSAA